MLSDKLSEETIKEDFKELRGIASCLLSKIDSNDYTVYDYTPFEIKLRCVLLKFFVGTVEVSNVNYYVSSIEKNKELIKFFTKDFTKEDILELIKTL